MALPVMNSELLPLPYVLVNRMMRLLNDCGNPVFAPDGKGQVTLDYDENMRPLRVATVLMSNAIDYARFRKNSAPRWKDQARQHCHGLFLPIGWIIKQYFCSILQ